MKLSISKTNIILALLLAVVILLGVNIILEKYLHPQASLPEKEISSRIINNRFLTALSNYNMDSSWISKKDLADSGDDSLKYFYLVNVPPDLPISLLIKEIENQFDTNEVNIYAVDLKSDMSTEIRIVSGHFIKLKSILSRNTAIKRKTDSIAFQITGIEGLNSEKMNELLRLPEHFACVLLPSKHSLEISDILMENQKQTEILLNDDINELEFRLKSSYSGNRIKNSLKSISEKFKNASFFIVDENSDIYSSQHFNTIKDWFEKRGLFLENEFKTIDYSSFENILSLLRSDGRRLKLFRISAEDFIKMPPVLASLRKIGYKIVNPAELLVHKN